MDHAQRSTGNERGQLLADLSNAIVRIHKQFYGKGPVKARAHLSPDLLVVVLEGGFTRGEQTLQDHGHGQNVVSSRLAMQGSVENEFRAAVESLLYRSVRSAMSANDPASELQTHIFVLRPSASEMLVEGEVVIEAPAEGQPIQPAREELGHSHEVLDRHPASRAEQEQRRGEQLSERNGGRRFCSADSQDCRLGLRATSGPFGPLRPG